jgi:glycosyltransferase involved in cell wall biosynthesis
MKILIISEFFPTGKDLKFSGGVEARTYFVSKYLAQKYEVHIITTYLPGTKNHELISGIHVHRVGPLKNYRAGANLSEIFSLIKFVRSSIEKGNEIMPDIVEGTNFITHFIAKRISSKNRIPLVFWYPDVFIGSWIKTSGLASGLIGEVLERINLLSSPDQFIAISNSTKNKLIKNNIDEDKISVIHCGVDPQEFDFKQPKFKNPTIICISRLVAYKKIDNLIWAYAVVRKKIPNLKLIIVGSGPEESRLKKMVKMIKVVKSVSFAKNLPRRELVKAIKSSHILCLPSQVEGFGICVIEAAASKIPYVISNIPVLREISKNGRGGLIFKTGSSLDLSKKLENLLQNRTLYEQKSREAFILSKTYS